MLDANKFVIGSSRRALAAERRSMRRDYHQNCGRLHCQAPKQGAPPSIGGCVCSETITAMQSVAILPGKLRKLTQWVECVLAHHSANFFGRLVRLGIGVDDHPADRIRFFNHLMPQDMHAVDQGIKFDRLWRIGRITHQRVDIKA